MGRKRLQERLLWFFLAIMTFSPLITILIFSDAKVFSDGQNDANFGAVILDEKTAPEKQTDKTIATNFKKAGDNIEILGRSIKLVSTNTTSTTPNNEVAQYYGAEPTMQGKFFFGHNSANIFAGLGNVVVGSTFKITKNGVAKTYRVQKVVTVANDTTLVRNMYDIAQAKYNGVSYSVSLMTCAGTSYGNGNATHRILLFANQI